MTLSNGRSRRRYFAISRCGEAARQLAEEDAISGGAAGDGPGLEPAPSRRRRSGVPAAAGVYFTPAAPGRSAAWQARTVLPGGKYGIRSFSVSRHGEDEARRLAEAERARMLAAKAESFVGPSKKSR